MLFRMLPAAYVVALAILSTAVAPSAATLPWITLTLIPNETLQENITVGSRVEVICQLHTSDPEMDTGLRWAGPGDRGLRYRDGYDADLSKITSEDLTWHELKLIIPVFRANHSGVYRCVGSYLTGYTYEKRSRWILLSVARAVTWPDCQERQQLNASASGAVRCGAYSGQGLTSNFTSDAGQPVNNGSSTSNVTSGAGQSGDDRSSGNGSSSTSALTGDPAPTPTTWFKDDEPFLPDVPRCRMVSDGFSCDPVLPGDAGSYVCFAGNVTEHGPIAGRRVAVEVLREDHVGQETTTIGGARLPSIVDLAIKYDKFGPLTIRCLARGDPPPTFLWLDDDLNPMINTSVFLVDNVRGILTVSNPPPLFIHRVYCRVDNPLGNAQVSGMIFWDSGSRPHVFKGLFRQAATFVTTPSSSSDSRTTDKLTTAAADSTRRIPIDSTTVTTQRSTPGFTGTVPITFVTTESFLGTTRMITPPGSTGEEPVTHSTTESPIFTPRKIFSPSTYTVSASTPKGPTLYVTTDTSATITTSTQKIIPATATAATATTSTVKLPTTAAGVTSVTVTTTTSATSSTSSTSGSETLVGAADGAGAGAGMIVGLVLLSLVLVVVLVDAGLYVGFRRGVIVSGCFRLLRSNATPTYSKWTAGEESNSVYLGADDGGRFSIS